jgi:LuxR family maltose regulon positive regulatory protein
LDGYIHLAHTKQAQGDADGAREAIQKAQQLAIKFDATDMDDILVAAHQVFLWVAQGGGDQDLPEAAVRWVEERGLTVEVALAELEERRSSDRISSAGRLRRTVEYLAFVRVLMAQRRLTEALAVLDSLLAIAEQWSLNGRVIRFQILRALILQAQGDMGQALSALERALLLAEPEGYVRMFVDEGQPMAQLLRQAAARGIAADYVSRFLAALEGETQDERRATEPPSRPSIPLPPSLIEPLSERELDVLRLLPTHLSSTEIAEELCISVNTVRYHIKNIYGKLGVHQRSDAVDRAEELRLL